jgi:hypothetical protein
MIIGTGFSDDMDSVTAAGRCARSALDGLDGKATIALTFCGGRHDPRAFVRALRKYLPDIPLVGGSAPGAMGAGMIGCDGFECVLLLFSSALSPAVVVRSPDLRLGERDAGRQLATDLMPHIGPESRLLLLFDSVAGNTPQPSLHVGSYLVDGIYDVLWPAFGEFGPHILGAGTIADFDLESSFIFDGTGVSRHRAVAMVLPAELDILSVVTHGCIPASDFLEITWIEGATVHQLDGKPAVQRLAELLELEPSAILQHAALLGLTLGEKLGDPFAPFDEGSYVNRLVIGADPASGSLTLFEADFRPGTRVQLMLTDQDEMCASAEASARALMGSGGDGRDLLAFYIDCAGRSGRAFGSEAEEAALVSSRIGADLPFLGIYSGVEIAPMQGRSRPLDWTGLLTLWRLRDPESDGTERDRTP